MEPFSFSTKIRPGTIWAKSYSFPWILLHI